MTQTQSLLIILVVIGLLAFRVYRQTREQRWLVARMWIIPILFLLVTAVVVVMDTRVDAFSVLAAVAGLAAGVGIGLYQGNHTTLRIDKANKAVFIRVTPLGSVIFVAIIAARFAIRFATIGAASTQQLSSGTMPAPSPLEALLGSGLLSLAAGAIVGLRLYVQRRYDEAPAGSSTETT